MPDKPLPDPYSTISVIEDLDPEPVRDRPLRMDLLLGVPLLLAVILFAGWQWWRQEYQAGQYRAGQTAVEQSDWDAAYRHFNEASGYSNADSLAQNAERQIEVRNSLYTAIEENAADGDWLRVLRDVRELENIQRGYASAQELGAKALDNVYTQAFSGTVVMRPNAYPPGLYFRADNEWQWLERSDEKSGIFLSRQGRIIYDGPNDGWVIPPAAQVRSAYQPDGPYKGRQVIAADFTGGKPTYAYMTLDPSYYMPLIAGDAGLWAIHRTNDYTANKSIHPNQLIRDSLYAIEFEYQPYSSHAGSIVRVEPRQAITEGTRVVALDPNSDRFLTVEWDIRRIGTVGADTTVVLYVQSAGQEGKEVYRWEGGFISAQFSPDGHYILARLFKPLNDSNYEQQNTVVIDLWDPARSGVKYSSSVPTNPDRGLVNAMFFTYIQSGAFAGKLLGQSYGGQSTTLWIVEPDADMNEPLVEAYVESDIPKFWRAQAEGTDGVFVIGEEYYWPASPSPEPGRAQTRTHTVVYMPPEGDPAILAVEGSRSGEIGYVRGDKGRIVWTEYDYGRNPNTQPPSVKVHSFLREEGQGGFGTVGNSSETLFEAGRAYVFLGPGAIAYYSMEQGLRVRSYDGEVDLPLDLDVTFMMSNIPMQYYDTVLR